MRRFSFVGRVGSMDKELVDLIQGDSAVFDIQLTNSAGELRFGIGDSVRRLTTAGANIPDVAVDLVVIALLVTAGDTRVSRSINAQDGWTREIDLYIPVSEPELWTMVGTDIEYILKFLTGDRWRLVFRPLPPQSSMVSLGLFDDELTWKDGVCLLSGGLDSFIGAIDMLSAGKRPLFVSHYWDSETANAQRRVLQALDRQFKSSSVRSFRVRVGFGMRELATGQKENTQRGRSFLFYSLATLCAAALNQDKSTVTIPENGLIALNVPADPLRLGPLSTRTAHPHFIARMNRLLKRLMLRIELVNPYRHRTKGEMVAMCKERNFLLEEVGNSMSCSSPAKVRYKGLSPMHCGYCVPCIIRRAALKAGTPVADPTVYAIDSLYSRPLRSDRAEGEDIRSLQMLARRVVDRPSLANLMVHKPGPLIDSPEEIGAYSEMFSRGMREVWQLLETVETLSG